ncbi:MAG TPA: choice-of-anchor B family protein [Longimicrobiales bacterium]|nr:choice-of-anchor B family protein [Longimicrobiales bacterium]
MRGPGTSFAVLALLAAGAGAASAQTLAGGSTAAARAGFGGSIEIVGSEILVGEPLNVIRTGLVYVYARQGTEWTERAQLRASDGASSDGFGAAIAADGESLLIGAMTSGSGGAAYLFRRDGSAWSQAAKITPDSAADGDMFGSATALAGDIAVIGAPGAGGQLGAAYVFRRGANSDWSQVQRLAPVGGEGRVLYGSAVAVIGNVVFVGAPGLQQNTGAVYVYRAGADGRFTSAGRLSSTGTAAGSVFGADLTVAGAELLVGAPMSNGQTGSVHRFAADPNTGEWREQARYLPFDGPRQSAFGGAVAVSGDELWVGAPRAARGFGSAYVFSADGDAGYDGVRRLNRAGTERVGFGGALDVEGDVAAVAMSRDDNGAGSVIVYERVNGEWTERTVLKSPPERIASVMGRETPCNGGSAANFECAGVDLLAFMNVTDLGGDRGTEVNDVWGWTDAQTGKEYALVGRNDGTSFVDISNPTRPVFVGFLPRTEGSPTAVWRDIKVYRDHAYIVADASGEHGVQVFDLARLRGASAPQTFTPDTTYHGIASAHNIVINEATGFAYAVGASSGGESCGGGLHMIDIRDPKNPSFAGCFADPQTGRAATGYSHDAVCVTYAGPDSDYTGREICFGSNETALSIADVTDKDSPKALSRASYPNVAYSHQAWPSEDHRYLFMNDELDELQGNVKQTRTLVWDITDLEDPQLVAEFAGTTEASDHNLYVRGNLMYQSHYQAGLRIVDISNPTEPREIGYFDTVPYGENTAGFGGSWSNYPYFESGTIIVTSGSEGLFLVKKRDSQPVS